MSKFNIGDTVKYIGAIHDSFPEFYPAIGTIGVIDRIDTDQGYWVQWPTGTTSSSDCWCCKKSDLELVANERKSTDAVMNNEEIWEMLRPKLVKNGLDWIHYGYDADGNKFYYFDETALKNAVAIAYKSGYYRSQKGRPFKIGEKKKKGGHWEPVDPNNLPKEGTKVRYSRVDINYDDSYIKLYDTGIIEYRSNIFCKEFGVKLNKERKKGYDWVFFGGSEDALDMWVEDDE